LDRVIIARVFAHAAAVAFEVVDLLVNRIVWASLSAFSALSAKISVYEVRHRTFDATFNVDGNDENQNPAFHGVRDRISNE
jgi:hypothetical protein